MIVHIDGNINKYYVETLCLVFFPGSTFGEHETPRPDVPEVWVSVYQDDQGQDTAYVSIKLNDRVCEATASVSPEEDITIATRASIAVGRAIFAAGKELLGHIPPWGILTGIRPAKIAGTLLTDGKGITRAKRILRDEYFLNPQKAALAVSIASTEAKLLRNLEDNTCSIYISIPFCPSRCAYCSFVSYTTPRLLSMIDEYLDALLLDLEDTFNTIKSLNLKILTIYIGGGTPTTLSVEQLSRIFNKIKEHINPFRLYEFTLEAGRPDTITKEKLALARKAGVTRISVNPQTLNDGILHEIGRRHTVEDFYKAYDIAKKSGIRDINVDLIAGLPGDNFRNFSETIDRVIELSPSNITVHTFCVKKASDALRKNSNIYSLGGADVAKCVSYSQIKTKFASYKPYYMYRQKNTVGNLENVGFSKEGSEGLYNIFMMEEIQSIFAVGAGAVTKLVAKNSEGANKILRIFKPKYPYEYLNNTKSGKDAEKYREKEKQQILNFYDTYSNK